MYMDHMDDAFKYYYLFACRYSGLREIKKKNVWNKIIINYLVKKNQYNKRSIDVNIMSLAFFSWAHRTHTLCWRRIYWTKKRNETEQTEKKTHKYANMPFLYLNHYTHMIDNHTLSDWIEHWTSNRARFGWFWLKFLFFLNDMKF